MPIRISGPSNAAVPKSVDLPAPTAAPTPVRPADAFDAAPSAPKSPVSLARADQAQPPKHGIAKFFDDLAHKFYGGWVQKPGALDPLAKKPPMSAGELAMRQLVSEDKLKQHVYTLADPKLQGRDDGSAGGIAARQYIEQQFKEIGLEPFFGDSFEQPIVGADGSRHGANVAGVLPASGPNPTGEYVMVFAHYDHVAPQDGKVIAGADDNASGVATMLEMARAMAAANPDRKYDIVFVSPDAEEPPDVRTSHMGSAYLMNHCPRPTEKMRLGMAIDVVGNDRAMPGKFLALGAESSAATHQVLAATQDDQKAQLVEASVSQVEKGIFPWERMAKSDYFGVRDHGRPFLFVTSGTTPHYHDFTDTADSLDYTKMAGIARTLSSAVLGAANSDAKVDFDDRATDPAADLRLLQQALPQLLAKPPEGLLASLRRKLESDQVRVGELAQALKQNGKLSYAEQYELMGIGLDYQRAVTRPSWSLAKIAAGEVWHKVKAFFGAEH